MVQTLVAPCSSGLRETSTGRSRVMQTDLGEIEVEIDGARLRDRLEFSRRRRRLADGGRFLGGAAGQPARETGQDRGIQGAANAPEGGVLSGHSARAHRQDRPGARHGVISMARDGPDTATDEFFICVGDQPSWISGQAKPGWPGFAAFGRSSEAWMSFDGFRRRRPRAKRFGRPSASSGWRPPACSDRINIHVCTTCERDGCRTALARPRRPRATRSQRSSADQRSRRGRPHRIGICR